VVRREKSLATPGGATNKGPWTKDQNTMTWQQITAAYMPALVIMVTVYIAAVSNNKRIDDVNKRFDDINKRFDDVNKRIDELRADFKDEIRELRAEMNDLRAEMKEGFRKIEERFEHPIARP
jgi:peptidoglycan hydrolase CwlO-like protein